MVLILKHINNNEESIEERFEELILDLSTEELANNVPWIEEAKKYVIDRKITNFFELTNEEANVKSIKVEKKYNQVAFAVSKNFWDKYSSSIIYDNYEENILDFETNIQQLPISILRGNNDKLSFLNNFEVIKIQNYLSEFDKLYVFVLTIAEFIPDTPECSLQEIKSPDNVINIPRDEISKKMFENNKPIAILVHGLGSKVDDGFTGLIECLYTDFNLLAFNYPSVSMSIDDVAQDFKRYIDALIEKEHIDINIFAHSKGGIVSRKVIGLNASIKTLTMAGTPNSGAWFARIGILISWLSQGAKHVSSSDISRLFSYYIPIGLKELQPGKNGYIENLNKQEKNHHKYYMLVGDYTVLSDGVVSKQSMLTNVKDYTTYSSHHIRYFIKDKPELPDAIDKARAHHKI